MLDQALTLEDRVSTAFYFRKMTPAAPELVDVVEKQATERVSMLPILTGRCRWRFRDPVIWPVRLQLRPWACLPFDMASCGRLTCSSHWRASLSTLSGLHPKWRLPVRKRASSRSISKSSSNNSVFPTDDLQQEPEKIRGETQSNQRRSCRRRTRRKSEGNAGKGPNPAAEGTEQSKSDEQSSGEQAGESKDEGAGQPSASQKGQQASKNPPKTPPKNAGDNPGVLDKMKDALANLLNKLGANQPQSSQESASNQSQQQDGKQQMSQKGTQGQGKAQGDSQQAPDPQGGSESDGSDKVPGQQQQASQQDSNKPGSENSKSGMGKSDGDKSIKDAEQLAAMGKISEIFGKRAAEIQGEMSVEVPSGKQQLKTAYSRSYGDPFRRDYGIQSE